MQGVLAMNHSQQVAEVPAANPCTLLPTVKRYQSADSGSARSQGLRCSEMPNSGVLVRGHRRTQQREMTVAMQPLPQPPCLCFLFLPRTEIQ